MATKILHEGLVTVELLCLFADNDAAADGTMRGEGRLGECQGHQTRKRK